MKFSAALETMPQGRRSTRGQRCSAFCLRVRRFTEAGSSPNLPPEAIPRPIAFPRGLSKENTLDFSFSGLKTALRNHIGLLSKRERAAILPDIAASFEMAIVDALVAKTVKAMEARQIRTVALVGGVAANATLRRKLSQEVATRGGRLCCPSPIYCTDNAAMIAAVGRFHLTNGTQSGYDLDADPRLKL